MSASVERCQRQRGTVVVLFALLLPVLLGFIALVVDLGHGWLTRGQLQNAADSAALAGARDLNGMATQYTLARASAQYYAAQHLANNTAVGLNLNAGNAPNGNIVLGNWDFLTNAFTPDNGSLPAYRVNAVKINTPTFAVPTWFATTFGINQENVVTSAIAVGGSPNASCGFPLVVPDCSILDNNGQVQCNATLTFGRATTDNVGFTLYSSSPGVNTPGINCAVARSLGVACPGGCNCTSACNASAISNGQIYISNGNNLSSQVVNWINSAVAAAPNGLYVQLPVLASGLSQANCGSFQFNRLQAITGYVEIKLTGASQGPPKTISGSIECTRSGPAPPGGSGGFFGYKSTTIYLVQ
jgi:Flp pilus assembly protein TadG